MELLTQLWIHWSEGSQTGLSPDRPLTLHQIQSCPLHWRSSGLDLMDSTSYWKGRWGKEMLLGSHHSVWPCASLYRHDYMTLHISKMLNTVSKCCSGWSILKFLLLVACVMYFSLCWLWTFSTSWCVNNDRHTLKPLLFQPGLWGLLAQFLT